MTESLNLTPFLDRWFMTADQDGEPWLTAVLSATFDFPRAAGEAPTPSPNPWPILEHEQYTGEPGWSSLYRDGQALPGRPGTDIALYGVARTPGAQPLAFLDTRLLVGSVAQRVRVFGKRTWVNGFWGFRPSEPEPFCDQPLDYSHAFGGICAAGENGNAPFDARNPIGMGFYSGKGHAINQPLPLLEDPDQPITSIQDRPQPAGYGLIARSWQPRVAYAGTYDARWQRERAPLWPKDFDTRFLHAAHPNLCSPHPLRGDESVYLEGFSHEGPSQFDLPGCVPRCSVNFGEKRESQNMALDGLIFDTETRQFQMVWRASFSLRERAYQMQRIQYRLREPWETAA
ncbi:DUF2169 family type VI secretion system accessory protein [Acanthopleuribacter pedis]|uniref:DUF2169 domain-containing protein n=1 Tax=Acanthopleuribacter pedis TaxID=442870 RepID=A0A8J7Q4J8_9BACT|nr:DUF2169 domain-containing protein [Acanthopleuribacter pedis]MBO1317952.1 DUF2169 domain-containing protein [Acanthopleuribacter pedis]